MKLKKFLMSTGIFFLIVPLPFYFFVPSAKQKINETIESLMQIKDSVSQSQEVDTLKIVQTDSVSMVLDSTILKQYYIIVDEETGFEFELNSKQSAKVEKLCKGLKCRISGLKAGNKYTTTMYEIADQIGLPIFTEANFDSLSKIYLVPLGQYVALNTEHIDPERAFVVKPLRDYLDKIGKEFYEEFHKEKSKRKDGEFDLLFVNSATRTVEKQAEEEQTNVNAVSNSLHMRGAAVDISWKKLTPKQRKWLEKKLKENKDLHIWSTKEEKNSIHYHICALPF